MGKEPLILFTIMSIQSSIINPLWCSCRQMSVFITVFKKKCWLGGLKGEHFIIWNAKCIKIVSFSCPSESFKGRQNHKNIPNTVASHVSCRGHHRLNLQNPQTPSSFSVSSQPELKRSRPAFSPATLVQIRCCLNIFQQLQSDSQDASAPTVTEWMTN